MHRSRCRSMERASRATRLQSRAYRLDRPSSRHEPLRTQAAEQWTDPAGQPRVVSGEVRRPLCHLDRMPLTDHTIGQGGHRARPLGERPRQPDEPVVQARGLDEAVRSRTPSDSGFTSTRRTRSSAPSRPATTRARSSRPSRPHPLRLAPRPPFPLPWKNVQMSTHSLHRPVCVVRNGWTDEIHPVLRRTMEGAATAAHRWRSDFFLPPTARVNREQQDRPGAGPCGDPLRR